MWTVKYQYTLCLQMKVAYARTTPPLELFTATFFH